MAKLIVFPGFVRCAKCSKTEATTLGNGQAIGLSAVADTQGIFGCWGSEHDNTMFLWVDNPLYEGDICDECINLLLGANKIKIMSEMPEAAL